MVADKTCPVGDRVCVIGAGVLGLVAIKNFKEQGLRVTAFERHERLGGSWDLSQKTDQVTALQMTTANVSKQTMCFTDFPFAKDVSLHPTAKDIGNYLQSYAHHFDLIAHIQFSTKIIRVQRDESARKWIVTTRTSASPTLNVHLFDRIVVATGILNTRHQVKILGAEKFGGEVMHSREFKDASRYVGKNVLVVGFGATGCDTASFLKEAGAENVFLSHRGQGYLLPKIINGKAFDHSVSHRMMLIMRFCMSVSLWVVLGLMAKGLRKAQFKAYPWLASHPSFCSPRAMPGAPLLHRFPVASNGLAENLKDGTVRSAVGIQEVSGPKSVTFTDGTIIDDLDAIIVCSGYHYDFSLVSGPGNPVDPEKAPNHYQRIQATPYFEPDSPFPRLYQGFISEQYPESLAFLGHMLTLGPPFWIYDLATMALSSMWSGNAPLPSTSEMQRDIDGHYNSIIAALHIDRVPHPGVRPNGRATIDWLNKAAGTGVSDQLGNFYPAAWKLWWGDRKFYNLLMDGVHLPAMYRLFDTDRGRIPWRGARSHIEATNKEVREMADAWKNQEKAKQN